NAIMIDAWGDSPARGERLAAEEAAVRVHWATGEQHDPVDDKPQPRKAGQRPRHDQQEPAHERGPTQYRHDELRYPQSGISGVEPANAAEAEQEARHQLQQAGDDLALVGERQTGDRVIV